MTTVHAYADDSSTRLGVTLDQIRQALDERGLLPAKAWGRRQFDAHCPCHQDKRPSLSIGETSDGRDLIHCHAGCDRVEILQALGLWHDRLPPLLRLLPSLNTPETTDHRVKHHCGGTGRTPTSNVAVSLWSPPERWRRRAAVLGVHAEPGESFECVIPGHQHEAKIERADGKRRYRCGSRPHGWSFAEVFVSVRVGSEQRLGAGPLTSRWFDLLSHEAGLLQPT